MATLKPLWSVDAGSPVLCLAAADLDGDGADDVAASTLAGRVLDVHGSPLAGAAAMGAISDMAIVAGPGGQQAVATATRRGRVHVFLLPH